jgi:toxin ParE1/3/4
MSVVRVELSTQADADIEGAALYFANVSASVLANFYQQLQAAMHHIAAFPSSGFNRYAHELNIPNLRYWTLHGFPYALFYVQDPELCYVTRCAHLASDIPASLREILPTQH